MRGAAARLAFASLGPGWALFAPIWLALALLAPVLLAFPLFLGEAAALAALRWPIAPREWAILVPGVAGIAGLVGAWRLQRARAGLEVSLRPFVFRWTLRTIALLSALTLAAAGLAWLLPGQETWTAAAEQSVAAGKTRPFVRLVCLGVPAARRAVDGWLDAEDPSYRFLAGAILVAGDPGERRGLTAMREAMASLRTCYDERGEMATTVRDFARFRQGITILQLGGFAPSVDLRAPVFGARSPTQGLLEWWSAAFP